jgi:hypothetical protein
MMPEYLLAVPEIINTIASLEICAPKVLVNQVTRLSI